MEGSSGSGPFGLRYGADQVIARRCSHTWETPEVFGTRLEKGNQIAGNTGIQFVRFRINKAIDCQHHPGTAVDLVAQQLDAVEDSQKNGYR